MSCKRTREPAEEEQCDARRHSETESDDDVAGDHAVASPSVPACDIEWSLMVRWQSVTGKTRTNSLPLIHLTSLSKLVGLSKDLFLSAYPEAQRPPHLTSGDYFTFTPEEECLSLPGDVARTTFRLTANYDGWEYVVLEIELGTSSTSSAHRMLVAVVEFESTAMVIGNVGIRLHLVAYPVIAVNKMFLRDIEERLQTDPNFKGILS